VVAAERRLRRLVGEVGDATVILSREASPLSFGGIEARLLRAAAHGVYDFDDALYAGYPGGALAWARHIDVVWRRSVRAADVVIAGNDLLADHASALASRVVVVPSCVEPADYLVKQSYAVDTPTLVWLGSPSTEPQLDLIREPLLAVHERLGARLRLISAGQRSHGELDRMIDRVAWTPEGVAPALAGADVGIMPLEDVEWTRGKCGYKLLQYGAAALPVVGSAVGVNVEVLQRLGGTAVRTPAEWRDALLALFQASDAERERAGHSALAGVTRHYSFAAWAQTWKAAIEA
jgi:glycosyltransferase involved in cell wall biosynthesis